MKEKRQKEYLKAKAPRLDFWPFPLVKSIKLSILVESQLWAQWVWGVRLGRVDWGGENN